MYKDVQHGDLINLYIYIYSKTITLVKLINIVTVILHVKRVSEV